MTLRVIAGLYGGRTISAPAGNKTHPMSEKMRGALFNMLGDLSGLCVLDAYSGSGALALEASSRGAAFVTAVEKDRSAYKTILGNIKKLDISSNKIKATQANISSWLERNSMVGFDIILCDPPYNRVNQTVLINLANHVKSGGLISFSLPPDLHLKLSDNYKEEISKQYGDGTLVIFRRIG